ncbi:MAG: hemolysin, partial [Myxococcaceae bacterium]
MKLVKQRRNSPIPKADLWLPAVALLLMTACGETREEGPPALGQAAAAVEGECVIQPPFNPNFEPELEWAWSGSTILPLHNQVMMTPIVVEVNGDGIPDVIFSSFAGSNYTTDGVLRAISGADGSDLWTVTDPSLRVRGAASVAGADIDGDGLVELCAMPSSGDGILCFENTGAFKFRTSGTMNAWGGVSFSDLDGDGSVEILNGNQVFSNTGVLKWSGADGMGGQWTGPISFAADIDGDGLREVVNDRAIYRHDGTLKCRNTSIGHGLAGVANFDTDPRGEVVVVSAGQVSLMDDDCTLLWTQALPGGGNGGAPNIADFDADGLPE